MMMMTGHYYYYYYELHEPRENGVGPMVTSFPFSLCFVILIEIDGKTDTNHTSICISIQHVKYFDLFALILPFSFFHSIQYKTPLFLNVLSKNFPLSDLRYVIKERGVVPFFFLLNVITNKPKQN